VLLLRLLLYIISPLFSPSEFVLSYWLFSNLHTAICGRVVLAYYQSFQLLVVDYTIRFRFGCYCWLLWDCAV